MIEYITDHFSTAALQNEQLDCHPTVSLEPLPLKTPHVALERLPSGVSDPVHMDFGLPYSRLLLL
jgi:hypothetical protein